MTNYFDLCGDYQPKSAEIHLDPMKLTDIYSEYEAELGENHEEMLDYKAWREAWVSVFPHVSIRQFKSVSGIVYPLLYNYLCLIYTINSIIFAYF